MAVVGVSADPVSKQKKFVEKYDFQYPMLCDESHEMLEAYKVWSKKKFMGREYMGINRYTYVINENGLIDKSQLKTVYSKVGCIYSDEECSEMIAEFGNLPVIDFFTFAKVMHEKRTVWREAFSEAFDIIDKQKTFKQNETKSFF